MKKISFYYSFELIHIKCHLFAEVKCAFKIQFIKKIYPIENDRIRFEIFFQNDNQLFINENYCITSSILVITFSL